MAENGCKVFFMKLSNYEHLLTQNLLQCIDMGIALLGEQSRYDVTHSYEQISAVCSQYLCLYQGHIYFSLSLSTLYCSAFDSTSLPIFYHVRV